MPPSKSSDAFCTWLVNYTSWLDTISNSDNIVIYTDGSFWRHKQTGAVAYAASINKRFIHESTFPCPAASSFDAELSAVHAALDWLTSIDKPTPHIYLLIDNIACLQSCLNTDIKTNQMSAIRINILMRHIFETTKATVHLCYCPSHVGIEGNEKADQLANSHRDNISVSPITPSQKWPTNWSGTAV